MSKLFDGVAERYDLWYESPIGSYALELEKEMILRFSEPKRGEKILDIGCGTGVFASSFAKLGLDVTCLDISEKMLNVAKTKRIKGIRFILGDVNRLPFEDETFDIVIAVTTLEFLEDPGKGIREMRRVLKKDGRIVLGILNKWSLWTLERKIRSFFEESVFKSARFYSVYEVKSFFGDMKFNWGSTLFMPPNTPNFILKHTKNLEEILSKSILKIFGGFIVIKASFS
ncbi:MAG: class I SAM-dependent methyltransferase [Candidatus Hydrothermarchaeota archaeon]